MKKDRSLDLLGWLEWAALPELLIPLLKMKVDTGAKTSSLHAEELKVVSEGEKNIARFIVRTGRGEYQCECPVFDERHVKSSSGHEELRIVVQTSCVVQGHRWPIELTLTDRTSMRYPMLLGRRAMHSRFLVDPSQKHLRGKPRRRSRS